MKVLSHAHEEVGRVRHHFDGVVTELRAASTSHLSSGRAAERARVIDHLGRYRDAGQFPKNRKHIGELVPTFVDIDGTHCAVAELMRVSGATDIIDTVHAANNHVLVDQLRGDVVLLDWLDQAGVTVDELARIQPSYCHVTVAEDCLCNPALTTAVIGEVVALAPSPNQVGVVHIISVHSQDSPLSAGMNLETYMPVDAVLGSTLLVQVYEGGAGTRGLLENGQFMCDGLSVDARYAADASTSSDCEVLLSAVDSRWGDSQCRYEDTGGCSTAGLSGFGAESVMAALFVASLRLRRRTR
jgi:hypothetical protein